MSAPERHANSGTSERADKAAQNAHSVPSAKRITSKSAIRIAVIAALFLGLIVPWIAFLIWLAIVAIFGRPGGSVHLLQLSRISEPSERGSQEIKRNSTGSRITSNCRTNQTLYAAVDECLAAMARISW
jgi:hypothetical protein